MFAKQSAISSAEAAIVPYSTQRQTYIDECSLALGKRESIRARFFKHGFLALTREQRDEQNRARFDYRQPNHNTRIRTRF